MLISDILKRMMIASSFSFGVPGDLLSSLFGKL